MKPMKSTFITVFVLKKIILAGILGAIVMLLSSIGSAEEPENNAGSGYRLEFSGKEHVVIPKLRYDGSHPLTLEAIVTPTFSNPRSRSAVVANLQLSGIGIHFSGQRWVLHVNDGRSGNAGYASAGSDEKAELKQTVHVAGVYDGKNVHLFVDGKLQESMNTTNGNHNASPFDFMIGADPGGKGKAHQFFDGMIDEVRISKTARYSDNFTPPDEKFIKDKETLVLYHFDEGEGKVAKDSSGNGHHGQIDGAKWVKETRKKKTDSTE